MLRAALSLSRHAHPVAPVRSNASCWLAQYRCLSVKFSKDHEWVKVDGDIATVGITDHAQEQLGDVVFVELPEVGVVLEQHATMGAVESVKAASDVYAPVSGEVTEINTALNDEPALVNSAAESDGWMAKFKLSVPAELDELMDKDGYEKFCQES
eukprot:CAMPEP_0119298578 /NCGR_PEP_ID=MMETSP1333-20130426/733_1 /TAXON_ID=418940 /ORGANISM="Scyphosphaera apsteinii, Strain RCC1455" /LENGTH=154 /DNA_ID=CAMNT_0007299709 /DNA_START=24 /DNA_END=488 /DNA_ORIENTATION=-